MIMQLFVLPVFNQKTLYNAYKKRTKNIGVDVEEYNRMKEADPEFYRDASSLQYGKVYCQK
jgi:pre-mRNA-splicing factor SYF2